MFTYIQYIQPNADTLAELEIISIFFASVPEFCPWNVQFKLVLNNDILLLVNPVRLGILGRLVLK